MRIRRIFFCAIFALLLTNILGAGVWAATELSKEKIIETAKVKESKVQDPYKDDLANVKADPQIAFQSAVEKKDMRFAAVLVGGYAPYQVAPSVGALWEERVYYHHVPGA